MHFRRLAWLLGWSAFLLACPKAKHDERPTLTLSYLNNPVLYTVGEAISPNVPNLQGASATSYSIAPSLPSGLQFDESNGTISGTPTAASESAQYTVTANTSAGAVTTVLVISVHSASNTKVELSYQTNPAVYGVGIAIAPNVPTLHGATANSFAVTPELPKGLRIEPSTGVLSGTPVVATPESDYSVTASTAAGPATAVLKISVLSEANTLWYPNSLVGVVGIAITPLAPRTDGAIASFEVTPALPQGLSLDAVTGVVSGTPQTVVAKTNHTVTGKTVSGAVTSTLTVTVQNSIQGFAVGDQFACALSEGAVYCWGRNDQGQLGVAAVDGRTPFRVPGLSDVTRITAGFQHACALKGDQVWCWGRNTEGQLGNGTTTGGPTLVQVSTENGPLTGVSSIAVGGYHSCAVANGKALCWGQNFYGQLGDNTKIDRSRPTQVDSLTQGVTSMAATLGRTCAIVLGALKCWGANDYGVLGNGSNVERLTPVQVLNSGVEHVALGRTHSCAVVNRSARCWGRNDMGQVGDGTTTERLYPVSVLGLAFGVKGIATGDSHSCAVKTDGNVVCWGTSIGTGSPLGFAGSFVSSPVVTRARDVSEVYAAHNATCVWAGGTLSCWGDNSYGQLGNSTGQPVLVPTASWAADSGATSVTSAFDATCAIINNSVKCSGIWGLGASWVLVTNEPFAGASAVKGGSSSQTCAIILGGIKCTKTDFLGTRTQTIFSSGSGVVDVVVGKSHACALLNGGVQCWGTNNQGQLGNGGISPSQTPVQVLDSQSKPLAQVQAISAGEFHSCALIDGEPKCWGANDHGQLGRDPASLDKSLFPVTVPGLVSGVKMISGFRERTCALDTRGVWCWGGNPPNLTQVTGLSGHVQAISTGELHSCAIVDGAAMCWGDNTFGQLGNGKFSSSASAVKVVDLQAGVQAISAGSSHTCAIWNGSLRCWGKNQAGQLGIGSSLNGSYAPVQVQALGF